MGASESNVMSVGLLGDLVEHAAPGRSGAMTLTAIAVVALADEVLEDLVLLLGRAVGRHLDVDLDLALLLVLVDAGGGDLPELAGVVGDERQLDQLRRGAPPPSPSGFFLVQPAPIIIKPASKQGRKLRLRESENLLLHEVSPGPDRSSSTFVGFGCFLSCSCGGQRATTSRSTFFVSAELPPTMISKRPGSTTRFIPSSKNASWSGPMGTRPSSIRLP